jgi:hypothetical protein
MKEFVARQFGGDETKSCQLVERAGLTGKAELAFRTP